MPRSRSRTAVVLVLFALCAIPAQAAPRPVSVTAPGLLDLAVDLLGGWSAQLVSLWERAGSGVDPLGNIPPLPEGSGSDPWGNHGTPPPEGSGSDPWGGS